ncbi:hypothetical protein BU16DRAFT_26265 [Lophium mytilinum]|uniref:C2H2-type domain-containing protein n=1 Tax=Lophium mytilinum TaxID=390894 RepID=A0A6A6REL1_9PEZI|nr:hypothetical protein BU16DRAFT_26265 [Lophium mytilinum]
MPFETEAVSNRDIGPQYTTSFKANNNSTAQDQKSDALFDRTIGQSAAQLYKGGRYSSSQYNVASCMASGSSDIRIRPFPDVERHISFPPLGNVDVSHSNAPTAVQEGHKPPYDTRQSARFWNCRCYHHTCKQSFLNYPLRDRHVREVHPEVRLRCHECTEAFESAAALGRHAADTSHAAFSCDADDCLATFARFDIYERHKNLHEDNGSRFPCPHCRKHRGANGFKRKDHLTQHLRNYHNMEKKPSASPWYGRSCPRKGCPDYRSPARWWDYAFDKVSDFTKHMKRVHDESPFPCTEPSCDRVGGKGYFRRRDLVKHQQKEHAKNAIPEANEAGA